MCTTNILKEIIIFSQTCFAKNGFPMQRAANPGFTTLQILKLSIIFNNKKFFLKLDDSQRLALQ